MCGIYGVISTGYANQKINKFFSDATIAGAVRGTDSVGIFQVDKKLQKVFIDKKAMSVGDFIQLKQARAIMNDVDGCPITIGHHRAATNGKIVDENAHPFLIHPNDDDDSRDFLIGVHNGSLTSWNRKDFNQEFEVDSHWALTKIAREGPDALNEIKGPFVFVWYDSRVPGKLHVARGTGRPFHLALSTASQHASHVNAVLMASEGRMLDWLAERNELYIKGDKIYSVEENTYLVIESKPGSVGEFTKKSIVPKTTTTSTTSSSSNFGFNNQTRYYGEDVRTRIKSLIEKAKSEMSGSSTPEQKPKLKGTSIELAKELGIHKKPAYFTFSSFDTKSKTCTGLVTIDDYTLEELTGRIHGVSDNMAEAMKLADFCETDVLAACPGDDGKPIAIIKMPTQIYASDRKRADKIESLLKGTKLENKTKLFGEQPQTAAVH
jgi:hypothetical protein